MVKLEHKMKYGMVENSMLCSPLEMFYIFMGQRYPEFKKNFKNLLVVTIYYIYFIK